MVWINILIAMAAIGLSTAGVVEHAGWNLPDDELGSSRSTSRHGKCEWQFWYSDLWLHTHAIISCVTYFVACAVCGPSGHQC